MSKTAVKWVFELKGDYSWESRLRLEQNLAFYDNDDKLRMTISKCGTITVKDGYAWDGCTPKFNVLDILLGTPDGVVHKDTRKPKAYYASLIHDALCQFAVTEPPYTRFQADVEFFRILERDDFIPRHLYFAAVVAFGWLTKRIEAKKRKHDGRFEPYEDASGLALLSGRVAGLTDATVELAGDVSLPGNIPATNEERITPVVHDPVSAPGASHTADESVVDESLKTSRSFEQLGKP